MISPKRSTQSLEIERVRDGSSRARRDVVTVEEPLEIRLATANSGTPIEHSVSVTMRTPGADFELAAGFLFTEGIIAARTEIAEIRYCQDTQPQEYNIVTVVLRDGVPFDPAQLTRNFYMTSSCGVCGKASLEAIEVTCAPLPDGDLVVDRNIVATMPDILAAAQPVFERTGGIHAASLIDAAGAPRVTREDVGRHNAVDKVIGHTLLESVLPAADTVLAVSGRASFEIMQKALAGGIPMVVAVGAPSSLAVDMARRFNQTLIGFARPAGYNIYTGSSRVAG